MTPHVVIAKIKSESQKLENSQDLSFASQVALMVKNLSANAENIADAGSIPGLQRSPGGDPHSIILTWRIPMDRGAGQARVHSIAKSLT